MFCCLYIPEFVAAALLRTLDDATRELPFAVLDGNPPLVHVVSMNQVARNAGMYAGMTKLQAEACAGVVLRRRSAAQEESAQQALLDCAYAFSPRVEATAQDTVLVDIAGLSQLFGSPEKIARGLAARVESVGMEARVAMAPNPDAAVLAARGFSGITVLEQHDVAQRLGHLPTDVLPTTPEVLETLERWGVRNLRSLAVLPPVALTERLGQEGLRLQKLAHGEHMRPLVPAEESFHFEERFEFEDAVDLLDPLSFVLNRMLEQLCMRLNARTLATNQLQLRMELEVNEDRQIREQVTGDRGQDRAIGPSGDRAIGKPENLSPQRAQRSAKENRQFTEIGGQDRAIGPSGDRAIGKPRSLSALRASCPKGQDYPMLGMTKSGVYERTLRLPVPMLDTRVFLKLLQLDLKAHPPEWPVKKISLTADAVRPRSAQTGLFLPLTPQPERLEVTLARIRGVVSDTNDAVPRVGSPELLDSHRPDAFVMKKFSPESAQAGSGDPGKAVLHGNGQSAPLTALRIFRPPLPARVEVRDGAPTAVTANAQRGTVVALAGPWRTSGEWWTEHAWSREEWDVALAIKNSCVLYRVFRDLSTSKWFVEASYD
jgi:nucleotidyltransferase/DNA polymerase involved in DNA repair